MSGPRRREHNERAIGDCERVMTGPDMGAIVRQAQKMQREMTRLQSELKERVVEGEAGGGMVKALVNGQQELLTLRMDPQVVDPEDLDMLQDLVVAAVNVALKKSRDLAQAEMSKATGGLRLPGLF